MTARSIVTDLLVTNLPSSAYVIPYAREIDPPSMPTVMIRLDKIGPSTRAAGWLEFEYALVLIAAQQTPGPADDELEDLLFDVFHALGIASSSSAGITYASATRAVYPPDNPSNPAFEVPITVTVQRESA